MDNLMKNDAFYRYHKYKKEHKRKHASYQLHFRQKIFYFILRKKRISEASHFYVGSSLSFLNLNVSEDISYIALL